MSRAANAIRPFAIAGETFRATSLGASCVMFEGSQGTLLRGARSSGLVYPIPSARDPRTRLGLPTQAIALPALKGVRLVLTRAGWRVRAIAIPSYETRNGELLRQASLEFGCLIAHEWRKTKRKKRAESAI